MPATEHKQGTQLFSQGEQVNNISIITKGVAETVFNGKTFRYEQSDILGLFDLNSGSYSSTYTAVTDVTIFSYPYSDASALETLFKDSADLAHLVVNSACRQIADFLVFREMLKIQAFKSYELLTSMYPKYEGLCKRYALSAKKLPAMVTLTPPGEDDPVDNWIFDYYREFKGLDADLRKKIFHGKPGICSGFFNRGTEDMLNIWQSCKEYQDYLQIISKVFLQNSNTDFFSLISELHYESINFANADETVTVLMTKLTALMSNMSYINKQLYEQKLEAYTTGLETKRAGKQVTDAPASAGLKQNLTDSLNVILSYSGLPEELCNNFTKNVHDYTNSSDRASSDEDVYRLRKVLTDQFYEIYKPVMMKSLNDPDVPTIVKMFLNFGYVDADLAGHDNADYLYSIVDSLKGNKEIGVYTFSEWMKDIYSGQKEPSRDDFDMDYAAHIREDKAHGRIDANEEAARAADVEAKALFELENVFPVANKVTFGRVTIFCPLFSDNNVQKDIEVAMVTPPALKEALDDVRAVDFSAFFREVSYTNEAAGVPREQLSLEVLPEIILMPNIGTRCVMWQEMNGRDRTSPSRLFVPMFMLEDLNIWMMRMASEFRWEYIKRIQGPRWGDITDPCITSEYFDYLQFYKSNRELSMEVRAAVKIELTRARNNYKSVFTSNYLEWVQFESKGSPRLNKFVRKILFEYCPFPSDVREKLSLNPQYSELLKKHDHKTQQREKHLSNVIAKITKANQEVPQELLEELEYTKR